MRAINKKEIQFTIIMEVGKIPISNLVTKPTGTKLYEIKRHLPLYYDKSITEGYAVSFPVSAFFLCCQEGIDVVPPSKLMAVHFKNIQDMNDFVQEITDREEDR